MALTKSSPTDTFRSVLRGLQTKHKEFPDFWKPNYTPNPKRKTIERMPFELPERPDPNMRVPSDQEDQLVPKIQKVKGVNMGSTDDLKYKQPDWLNKILVEPPQEEAAKNTFRKSVTDWMTGMGKGAKQTIKMKPRKPLFTSNVNEDKQLGTLE